MVRVSFSTGEIDALTSRLGSLTERLADLRPLYEGYIEQEFYAREARLFDSEGRDGGQGWKPLDPDYARWKARAFPGKPILQRSGKLRASLTGKGAPMQHRLVTSSTLELGTLVPYAPYVDARRPVLVQADIENSAWANAVDSFLSDLMKEVGV